MALWGGRFESGPDALFRALNDSLPFDYRFALQDIRGSVGWARAIARAGVLSAAELTQLEGALGELEREVLADPMVAVRGASPPPPSLARPRDTSPAGSGGGAKAEPTPNPSLREGFQDEDIHSWVERRLIEKVGTLGKKLHTGRSRNDQVATDFRMYVRDEIDARLVEMHAARASLVALAEREIDTIIPGYTHLQRAQPVLLAHWCLAYFEMLSRDEGRLCDARRRVNRCPLGSGALAGTAYQIERDTLARELGFDGPTSNSLDAVSDRDFVIETLAALSLCAVHLSRLGEDLILYGSQEFGFFEYSDSVSSGSSLMPQKKNPDAAELLRGKSGRVVGALVSLLVTVKGLPLAYNKDLQEDKEPLFEAMHHVSLCLRVMPPILDGLTVRREVCERAAQGGHANATDLADYLVGKGVPFREAHEIVGRAVRHAIAGGKALEELPLSELHGFGSAIGPDVFARLTLSAGLAQREVLGGTGTRSVREALRRAREGLARLRT